MSGKLFIQIVLLIIITAIVMVATKVGVGCYLKSNSGKSLCGYGMMRTPQK